MHKYETQNFEQVVEKEEEAMSKEKEEKTEPGLGYGVTF